jgi:hypothetical protein
VVEASAMLLVHLNKLDAEPEVLGPAYGRQRHTYGRIRVREEEAELEIISHFD